MRDVWGERGWGNIGVGGSAVFLHSVCRAPPTKNILYGAMLGAMCEMYGGKRVGETLGGSAVFLHSVCAWVSKRI